MRRRNLIRAALALLLVLALAVVVVWRVPVFLPPPSAAAPELPAGDERVFGYATLANPLVRAVVAGRWLPGEPAELPGWERVGRDLRPEPGGRVEGVVFTVPPAALHRLDRYERAGERYLRRRKLIDDGGEAWVYRLIEPGAPP
jgi:hypothetical protein